MSEVSAALINSNGTEIDLYFNEPSTVSSNGQKAFILHREKTAAIRLVYKEGASSVYTWTIPNFPVTDDEVITLEYDGTGTDVNSPEGPLAAFTGKTVTNNSTKTFEADFDVINREADHEVGTAVTIDARNTILGDNHFNDHLFKWTITDPDGVVLNAGVDKRNETTRELTTVDLEGCVMMFIPEVAGTYTIKLDVYDGAYNVVSTKTEDLVINASSRTATYTDTDLLTGNNDGSSWENAYQTYADLRNSERTNDDKHHYIRGNTALIGNNSGDWSCENVVIEGIEKDGSYPTFDLVDGSAFRLNNISKFTIKNFNVEDSGDAYNITFIRRGNSHDYEDLAITDITAQSEIYNFFNNTIDNGSNILFERIDGNGQIINQNSIGVFFAEDGADIVVVKDCEISQSDTEHGIRVNLPNGTFNALNILSIYDAAFADNKTAMRTQAGRYSNYTACDLRGPMTWGGDGGDVTEGRVHRCLLHGNEFRDPTVAIDLNPNPKELESVIGFYNCRIRNTDNFGTVSEMGDDSNHCKIAEFTEAKFHNCSFYSRGWDGAGITVAASGSLQLRGCSWIFDIDDTLVTNAGKVKDNDSKLYKDQGSLVLQFQRNTFPIMDKFERDDSPGDYWDFAFDGDDFETFVETYTTNEAVDLTIDEDGLMSGGSKSTPEIGVLEDYYGTPVSSNAATFRGAVLFSLASESTTPRTISYLNNIQKQNIGHQYSHDVIKDPKTQNVYISSGITVQNSPSGFTVDGSPNISVSGLAVSYRNNQVSGDLSVDRNREIFYKKQDNVYDKYRDKR